MAQDGGLGAGLFRYAYTHCAILAEDVAPQVEQSQRQQGDAAAQEGN